MAAIEIYQLSRTPGFCRSCGARITWAIVVKSGNRIPLDAGAAVLSAHADLIDGRIVELIDRTHFATCPDAQKWRRK